MKRIANALCIRCGEGKKHPWQQCDGCGLLPEGEELVKSVYCSVGRFEEAEDRERYRDELAKMAETIKSGGEVAYDEAELERLRLQKEMVESVTGGQVLDVLLRMLLPVLGMLLLAYWLSRVL